MYNLTRIPVLSIPRVQISRHAPCRLVMARAYQPSSRRAKVLQRHAGEFFWGSSSHNSSFTEHEPMWYADPDSSHRSLHRQIEDAHSPEDLIQVLLIPDLDLRPESVSLSLLRLAAWHTAPSSVPSTSAIDLDDVMQAMSALEDQLVRCAKSCTPAVMANIMWALATLRGPACADDAEDDLSSTRSLLDAGDIISSSPASTSDFSVGGKAPSRGGDSLFGSCRWPGSDDVLDAIVEWGLAMKGKSPDELSRGVPDDDASIGDKRLHNAEDTRAYREGEEDNPSGGLPACSTQDLVSMIWGYSALLEQARQAESLASVVTPLPQRPPSTGHQNLVGGLPGSDRMLEGASSSGMNAVEMGGVFGLHASTGRAEPSGHSFPNQDQEVSASGSNPDRGKEWEQRGQVLDGLCLEMVERFSELRTGSEFHPQDLTDMAWGIAVSGRRSPAIGYLLDALSHEVYRQLSNRHSLNQAFLTADLIKLLEAFADIHLSRDAIVPLLMIDAVAGYIVKRIRARHVNSVSRPRDIAAVLRAFVRLEHNSIVVPELLRALSHTLTMELAGHNEWVNSNLSTTSYSEVRDNSTSRSDPESLILARSWGSYISPELAVEILEAHRILGYSPGGHVVTSLLVALLPQLPVALGRCSSSTLACLLELLADFEHSPGKPALSILSQEAKERMCSFTPKQLLRSSCALVTLGCRDGGTLDLIDRACQICLLGHCEDDEDATMHGAADQSGLEIEIQDSDQIIHSADACRLLAALMEVDKLTIQWFGLVCMAVRDDDVDGARKISTSTRQRAERPSSSLPVGTTAEKWGTSAGLEAVLAAGLNQLGEEGREMAEEVLSEDLYKRIIACALINTPKIGQTIGK